MTGKLLLRIAALLATVVVIALVLKMTGSGDFLNKAWIDSQVRGTGFSGEALFVIVGIAVTAVGLPRQLVSFLAGYAFGAAIGTALALAATVGGCIVAFYYARFLGRELVAAKASGRIRKLDRFLGDNPFTMTLLIRLLPAGSNFLTNLAAGVSSVGALAFIAGSATGYIPQVFIFALAGSGVNLDGTLRIAVSVVLFAVAAALGVYVYRRFRHGHSFEADAE